MKVNKVKKKMSTVGVSGSDDLVNLKNIWLKNHHICSLY